MQVNNQNQLNLAKQTAQELYRINREIASESHRLRTEQGFLIDDIAILSGGTIPSKKLDRIELQRIFNLPVETVVSLGLVLKHRVKIIFDPISPSEQNVD